MVNGRVRHSFQLHGGEREFPAVLFWRGDGSLEVSANRMVANKSEALKSDILGHKDSGIKPLLQKTMLHAAFEFRKTELSLLSAASVGMRISLRVVGGFGE